MKFITIVICLMIIMATEVVYADTFLRYKKTTDPHTAAGSNVTATTGESTAWIGKVAAAYDDGEGTRTIVHFKKRTLTMLDMTKKKYSVMHIDSIGSMINSALDNATDNSEDAQALKTMMQGMMGTMLKSALTVTKSDIKKKIGIWNCSRYDVSLNIITGATQSELWVTKQINVDPAWFNLLKTGMLSPLPGFSSIAEELKKIEGIPVKTITRTQSMNTTVTSTELLQESTEKKAPKGMYTVPDSFTKK